MRKDDRKAGAFSQVKETAGSRRAMVRAALKGALATVQKGLGHPYASLVLVATDTDGSPILLISKLALHTQNLAADPRASLLIDATGTEASPDGRRAADAHRRGHPATSTTARARFLAAIRRRRAMPIFPISASLRCSPRARISSAASAKSSICRQRIFSSQLRVPRACSSEPDIVSHMNADHADASRSTRRSCWALRPATGA